MEQEQARALENINSLSTKQKTTDSDIVELREQNSYLNLESFAVRKQNEAIIKEHTDIDLVMNLIGNQYEEMRSELAKLMKSEPNVAGHVADMGNVATYTV